MPQVNELSWFYFLSKVVFLFLFFLITINFFNTNQPFMKSYLNLFYFKLVF